MYYRGENNEIIEAYGSKDVPSPQTDCTTTPTWLIILLIIILVLVIAFVVYSILRNKRTY
jgi:hypothetical protein